MNKHTSVKPTPFKIEPTIFHIHQPDPRGKDWYDLFGKDFYVGRIIDEQKAAYIVKAVNSHETLVRALKEAQSYILTRKGKEFNIKDSDYFSISVVMVQALTLAEKE